MVAIHRNIGRSFYRDRGRATTVAQFPWKPCWLSTMLESRMPSVGAKGIPRFDSRPPEPPAFAIASLWVLFALCGILFLAQGFSLIFRQHEGFNCEDYLQMVLGFLAVLCAVSTVGLKRLRPWGWWIGMAALGISPTLGGLLLLMMCIPAFRPFLGNLASPEEGLVAVVFLVWCLPGVSLWNRRSDFARAPGRSGK